MIIGYTRKFGVFIHSKTLGKHAIAVVVQKRTDEGNPVNPPNIQWLHTRHKKQK